VHGGGGWLCMGRFLSGASLVRDQHGYNVKCNLLTNNNRILTGPISFFGSRSPPRLLPAAAAAAACACACRAPLQAPPRAAASPRHVVAQPPCTGGRSRKPSTLGGAGARAIPPGRLNGRRCGVHVRRRWHQHAIAHRRAVRPSS
jgi:hypothetical protein